MRPRLRASVGPLVILDAGKSMEPIEAEVADAFPAWRRLVLPGLGLMVLAPPETLADLPEVAALLDELEARPPRAEVAPGAPGGESNVVELALQNAAAVAQRAEAEIEEVREALIGEIDETRAQQAMLEKEARELRFRAIEAETVAHEARGERAMLIARAADLRAELDVANAERNALEQRFRRLAAEAASTGATSVGAAEWSALPPVEADATAAFLEMYRDTLSAAYDNDDLRDALSLPSAVDRRGIFTPAHDESDGRSVDVVIAVHNALEDVRMCLWSLVHKSTLPFHLILVNDGSDVPTTHFLQEFAARNPSVSLIDNPDPPHGYTIAANLGVRASSADYVVLLNSDTIVTFGWLERILARGEAEPGVGILGPLSNAASHQSVPELRDTEGWATNPLPDWATPDAVAFVLDQATQRVDARLPFINGFCYVVKRAVFDAIGEFDEENFATGYCEENDFSQRARVAGFALAVADAAYVFHAKSKSFGTKTRQVIAKRNYQIFLDKHGRDEMNALVAAMEADPTLAPVRAGVAEAMASPDAYRAVIARASEQPLSIVFVLPGLGEGGSGGSHSIYQEVSGLRQLGVPARIALWHAAMDRARAAYDDADEIFEPFSGTDELIAKTADADVISATHYKSVPMVAAIRAARRDFLPAYYVQDYEPFFAQPDSDDAREAVASYAAMPDALLFAKTHWLCNIVGARHGLYVAKVEPSIDEQLYVPAGELKPAGSLRVAAMIRPRTPRRQPFSTVQVLDRLMKEYGDAVAVTTFGCGDDALAKVTNGREFRAEHLGLLKRREVAGLLQRTDVFLDMSTYQAFGRTALEAMACGATAVVPRVGGAWEFGRHEDNALLVDTLDRRAAYEALAGLAEIPERVAALRASAQRTGSGFSIMGAALSEYLTFRDAHAQRFGRRAPRAAVVTGEA